MMRRAWVSFFFVASLSIISGFFTTNMVYATTAQCENEAGFCAAPGVCNGEAPTYKINYNIACDSTTDKCCVPSNIQTACETSSSFGLGTCSNTCSSGQTSMQNLYGDRSQISCSPYPTKVCCSYCSYDLKLQNASSTIQPDPIVCVPSCSKTSSGAKTPLGPLLWSVNYSYCGGSPTVYGSVYVDNNSNGVKDAGEPGYSGATLTMKRVSSTTFGTDYFTGKSNSSGNYFFSTTLLGTHTVTLSVPPGYKPTTATLGSRTITTSNFTNRTFLVSPAFGISPTYSITGSVFNDMNKNYVKDAGEGKDWTAAVNFDINPVRGTKVVNPDGSFSITGLDPGTYTITLSSGIPKTENYQSLHPVNGPPPTFLVTVGPGCTYTPQHPNSAGNATCSNGNISNLNFVITNSIPWFQTYGLDVRIDTSFDNIIPLSPLFPAFMSVIDNLD